MSPRAFAVSATAVKVLMTCHCLSMHATITMVLRSLMAATLSHHPLHFVPKRHLKASLIMLAPLSCCQPCRPYCTVSSLATTQAPHCLMDMLVSTHCMAKMFSSTMRAAVTSSPALQALQAQLQCAVRSVSLHNRTHLWQCMMQEAFLSLHCVLNCLVVA